MRLLGTLSKQMSLLLWNCVFFKIVLRIFVFLVLQCDGPAAVRRFLDQVNLPSLTLIGVIGCGCSVATDSVADFVSVYGLPLVSEQ